MKRNMKKKVMAGSMAVVMAAGLAGTYGYQNTVSEVKAKEKEVRELTETAEEVLGGNDADQAEGIFKDEAVYVKADPSGKVTETTVTEWLKNPGKGTIEDVSGLDDIKNIKGEETFTEGNGEELSWKSEGNDIYYQGTTEKELPVDVKLSYRLDGKKISAKDLDGKNGKVEIRIDYENKSKETVEVDGEKVEMYTPFTMVTALMLPTDEYQNVTVDNGKVLSDADKGIVVGLAFPGLEENLNLQDIDVDIPDSVTITADVKDASVGPTITLASAEIMDELDLDDVDDFDSLEDSLNELEDAAGQLVDGSKEAADGAKELADGSNELAEGSGTLAEGSETLADGVNTLDDKSGDLISGVNELAAGVNKYTSSVSSLADGTAVVASGAQAVQVGASQIQNGVNAAKAGADELVSGIDEAGTKVTGTISSISGSLGDVSSALNSAETLVDQIDAEGEVVSSTDKGTIVSNAMSQIDKTGMSDAQKSQIQAAISSAVDNSLSNQQVKVTVTGKDDAKKVIEGANGGVSTIQQGIQDNSGTLTAGMEKLSKGAKALQAGLGQGTKENPGLSAGSASLASGAKELSQGADKVAQGAAALNESSSLLTVGTSKLKEGGSQLAGGVGQLANGADAAADGAKALADGSKALADGAGALADGNQALADGMSEFKTSGIDKLTEVFDGDISKVTSRIDAMVTLGQDYKSFAGIKEGMDGSTKFIIETEGID